MHIRNLQNRKDQFRSENLGEKFSSASLGIRRMPLRAGDPTGVSKRTLLVVRHG